MSVTINGNGTVDGLSNLTSGDLTVDTNTLYVDAGNNRVGIGTTSPTALLHVNGTAKVTSMSLNGVTLSDYTLYAGQVTRVSNGGGIGINSANSADNAYIYFGSGTTSAAQQSAAIGRIGGDVLAMFTASAERMRIDSVGNVGIGTSSPVAKLGIVGGTSNASNLATAYSLAAFNIIPKSTSGYSLQFGSGPSDMPYIQMSAGGSAAGNLLIQPYGGNVLVNTTGTWVTAKSAVVGAGTASTFAFAAYQGGGTAGAAGAFRVDGPGTDLATWYYQGGVVGRVTTNSANTTYGTSSDYRLKENIAPMIGALDTVARLKPVTYKWKQDGSDGQGFIAHELQEIVPDAVQGEKDAVETYTDEEGNEQTRPKYQGVDTSFLVATLTAAIQEQQAIIEELKTRIITLENK